MSVPKPVTREEEVLEFRPIAGLDEDWPTERSRLWDALGVYPILISIIIWLVLLAMEST
jgi:hypothetical protein